MTGIGYFSDLVEAIDRCTIPRYTCFVMLSMDAMPRHTIAPGEPGREPSPIDDVGADEQVAVDHHLEHILARLQTTAGQPESPERTAEMQGLAGEYVLGLLEGLAVSGGPLETQLIAKGARTARGTWQLDSGLFTFLADQMASSLPTRLRALRSGQYKDTQELNAGMSRQLRNLVGRYEPRRNVYADRRPRSPQPPTTAV